MSWEAVVADLLASKTVFDDWQLSISDNNFFFACTKDNQSHLKTYRQFFG
jgi:hypothetical protein